MIITQNGKAAMVIQSVIDYEQTLASLALLKLLAQSQQAVKEGKVVSSAEAFAQLRRRRGFGNYVEDRQQWQKNYSVDDILAEMDNFK